MGRKKNPAPAAEPTNTDPAPAADPAATASVADTLAPESVTVEGQGTPEPIVVHIAEGESIDLVDESEIPEGTSLEGPEVIIEGPGVDAALAALEPEVTGDEAGQPEPMRKVRFRVAVAGPDWCAKPTDAVELPASEAAKWADGVRAEYVD